MSLAAWFKAGLGDEEKLRSNSCVIFDCDGVLVDSELLAARAYQYVYSDHGLVIDARIMQDCIGLKQADIIEKIAKITGLHLPIEGQEELWPTTKKLFEVSLMPTTGIANYLAKSTISRCVASSSSMERIHLSLGLTGLLDFFKPWIFSSAMVQNGKPAPDLFLLAAQQMGYAPNKCVVIEDSFLGVQGAVAAGMQAIGFVGGAHSNSQSGQRLLAHGAKAICSNWQEVAATLSAMDYDS